MGKPMNKSAKGASKAVIKNNDKNKESVPREPKMIEQRMDPSDGNGPFTHASFIRFHGEEKGQQLWDEGADTSIMVEARKKGKGKGKKGGKKPAPVETQKKPVQKHHESSQPRTQQNKVGKGKKLEEKSAGKEGKKGKGKGKNTQKGGAEKRIDPSDGKGPFTQASFIRFHGEEKGNSLWNQAGPSMKKDNTSNPFN